VYEYNLVLYDFFSTISFHLWHRETRKLCHHLYYLKERDNVILNRRKYLRQKRLNRNPDGSFKRVEVYLDETYVAGHAFPGRAYNTSIRRTNNVMPLAFARGMTLFAGDFLHYATE